MTTLEIRDFKLGYGLVRVRIDRYAFKSIQERQIAELLSTHIVTETKIITVIHKIVLDLADDTWFEDKKIALYY